MDEATQQNSALVEENAASAKSLEQQAAAMDERVRQFQISAAQTDETASVMLRRDAPAATKERPERKAAPAGTKAGAPKANGRNPVARMQANVATAFKQDHDWTEF
jgi:methyl-accepting chemotaxis protein